MEDDVIKTLKALKDEKLREADAIDESIKTYMLKMGYSFEMVPAVDHSIATQPQFPDYPINDSLITKIGFLESREKLEKWWRRGKLQDILVKQEGGRKSLGSIQNLIKEYVDKKELIRIVYRNSNKLTFYTTDKELLYTDDNGKWLPIFDHLPAEAQDWERDGAIPECSLNK